MIQPKYSPQEALEKIKLSMKYNLSKTLNENKGVVSEQTAACQNTMEKSEVTELATIAGNGTYQLRTTGARMFNQQESADAILDSVKQIKGKNVLDPATGECVPAKTLFEKRWKVANKGKYGFTNYVLHPFSDDDKLTFSQTLKMLINSDYYKESSHADTADVLDSLKQALKLYNENVPATTTTTTTTPPSGRQNNINNAYCSVKDGKITLVGSKYNGTTWDSWIKLFSVTPQEIETAKSSCSKVNGGGGQYKQCPETLPIAMYCKNSTVSRVQGCLGIKQDGAFGPLTSQGLVAKGIDGQSITQATIDKVCGGGVPDNQGSPITGDAEEEETGAVTPVTPVAPKTPPVVTADDADETS